MKNINQISDTEIDEIINGCIEGVYPTSHEVAMALELKNLRSATAHEQEPDFVRASCGSCGYETTQDNVFSCPTCLSTKLEYTNLFTHPAPSIPGEWLHDLNRLRQWFNSMEDTNPNYVEEADRELNERIMKELRVMNAGESDEKSSA